MKRSPRALALALAAAMAVPQALPTEAPSTTVSPAQPNNNNREQTPAPISARAQAVLEELAGGFKYYRTASAAGIPWPGRAAARARHRAGSGRRPK